MDLGIRGKKALVCASSKGLGRGCAEALAAEGVDLVINARTAETLERTATEIADRHGVTVTPVAADITTEEGRDPEARLSDALFHHRHRGAAGEQPADPDGVDDGPQRLVHCCTVADPLVVRTADPVTELGAQRFDAFVVAAQHAGAVVWLRRHASTL